MLGGNKGATNTIESIIEASHVLGAARANIQNLQRSL